MAKYVHDDNNNRIEALSKEEIYALLAAAIQQGQLPSVAEDTAFVTMFKSIVDGKAYKMAFCTTAQYNALEQAGELEADALYIITDDETYEALINNINSINNNINSLDTSVNNINNKINKVSVDPSNITQAGIYVISASYTDTYEDFAISDTIYITSTGTYQILSKYCKYTRANGIQLLPEYQNTYTINACDLIYKI